MSTSITESGGEQVPNSTCGIHGGTVAANDNDARFIHLEA